MRYRLSARERGYTTAWDKASRAFLAANPICVMCERQGIITPATVTDHITPHRGDQALFWDRSNWQPLCRDHHDRDKQRAERGRQCQSLDADGWPL